MAYAIFCICGIDKDKWYRPCDCPEKFSGVQPTKLGRGVYRTRGHAHGVAKNLLNLRQYNDLIFEIKEVEAVNGD